MELKKDGLNDLDDNDYTLTDGAGWFEIKGFAVRIFATEEGVRVDIYKDKDELSEPIDSALAFYTELL